MDAKLFKDEVHVVALGFGFIMADVAHVKDDIGGEHLLQRGAERGDQRGGKFRDESDGVGQDNRAAARQDEIAHGRIKGCEEQILGEHIRRCQLVEECGFSGVGVTHKGDYGKGHALPALAVQIAGFDDGFKFALDLGDALLNQAAVHFKLAFAGAADESEAAALALQVGP